MTPVEQVKRKLWQYKYNVLDMTKHKFINDYDLVVEGIYRVSVTETLQINSIPIKIDAVAFVEKSKITFYKDPYINDGKLCAEKIDTSPLTIFIKNERTKHTNNVLRGKETRTRKTSTRNKSK